LTLCAVVVGLVVVVVRAGFGLCVLAVVVAEKDFSLSGEVGRVTITIVMLLLSLSLPLLLLLLLLLLLVAVSTMAID